MATLETRRAAIDDAIAMSRLVLELGYDCDDAAMRHRLARLRELPEHAAFVAAIDGTQVVGFVHARLELSLLSPPLVQVDALVVASGYRKLGVGRALMHRAETWAERFAVGDVRVSTQQHRAEAHAFYERLGYVLLKEQRVYRRAIERSEPGGVPTIND